MYFFLGVSHCFVQFNRIALYCHPAWPEVIISALVALTGGNKKE